MLVDVLGKTMKLVTYVFFSLPLTYNLFLLVIQPEKEWMTEKRQGYFQSQLLFPGLQLFQEGVCFSEPVK